MLENLSDRFNKVFKYLKGEVKITEENIGKALKEIKLSLLEADVNFRVVKDFIGKIREEALGPEHPGQSVVMAGSRHQHAATATGHRHAEQGGDRRPAYPALAADDQQLALGQILEDANGRRRDGRGHGRGRAWHSSVPLARR